MHVRLLAGAVLCGALAAFAETNQVNIPAPGNRAMSLQDCVDQALSRNLDLRIQHLSTDIAGYNLNASYGAYVPTLGFDLRRDYVAEPGTVDPKKHNPDYPYSMESNSGGPKLTGEIPMGMSYEVGAQISDAAIRTDFHHNPSLAKYYPGGIRWTNAESSEAYVSARQHLLKDFWIDPHRETILLRRKDLSISEQALKMEIMRTVLAVEQAYFDLAAACELVRAQEKALELRRELVAETRRRVQVGDLPPLDADQAETQLQNTLTALTAAREVVVDRQDLLKQLLTDKFEDWVDENLRPADALLAIKGDFDRRQCFANALKNRPDLIEARLAVERNAVEVRFRQNQLYPKVDLIGRYGGLGNQVAVSSAVSDALHFRNSEYYYGVEVSLPLSNVSERNNYRSSKAAQEISRLQLKKAEQQILVVLANFLNQAESRFSQVDSTRQARIYAEAALAAEEKKLQNGLSTTYLVLQARLVFTAARTAESQALVDYNKALSQIAFGEGATLDRYHLKVDGRPR